MFSQSGPLSVAIGFCICYSNFWLRCHFSIWVSISCYVSTKVEVAALCSHQPTLVPHSRIFLPWRWRRYVPPKRRFTQDVHRATSQKTAFFKLVLDFNILLENHWSFKLDSFAIYEFRAARNRYLIVVTIAMTFWSRLLAIWAYRLSR
jgi:hypothetical protein